MVDDNKKAWDPKNFPYKQTAHGRIEAIKDDRDQGSKSPVNAFEERQLADNKMIHIDPLFYDNNAQYMLEVAFEEEKGDRESGGPKEKGKADAGQDAPDEEDVWILLIRHTFMDYEQEKNNYEDRITVDVYEKNGERAFYASDKDYLIMSGVYRSEKDNLFRIKLKRKPDAVTTKLTVVVCHRYFPFHPLRVWKEIND